MNKWVKNTDVIIRIWHGKILLVGEYYCLESSEEKIWASNSNTLLDVSNGTLTVAKDDSGDNDITDFNEAINFLKNLLPYDVKLEGVDIESNRLQNMNNRVPNGYSLYVTGESDDINNGIYGNGEYLHFDAENDIKYFQLLYHYYAIGARAVWQDCSINNYFNATLIAPASSGAIQQTGNFNKYEIIPESGLNIFIPTNENEGSWDINLEDKLPNTQILKATPVPSEGNNGWFDYNSSTNIITPNFEQNGGYNLYDFDINLHSFGRKIWGSPLSGCTTSLDISDLVGKLLFNSWKIKLEFNKINGSLSSEKVAVMFIVASKKNI